MSGLRTPDPSDVHAMVADIPQHPAAFLTAVDRQAHHWVTLFAAGEAVPADLAAFKQWAASDPAHSEAFARVSRLWEAIGPASKLSVDAAPAPPERLGRRAVLGGALAASAAAVAYLAVRPPFGLWPSVSELASDYRTAPGEQRRIALAKGPSIELNTRTSIAVRSSAGNAARLELISGEALITTAPGNHPIEVIAANGRATTDDAIFNIRYEQNSVCTTCIRGALEITYGERAARLRSGEQITYSPEGLEPAKTVDPDIVTAWKDGVLVFQSTPLAEAIAEINRYRSGHIIVTNTALGRRLFNARFKIANIDSVVAQIQQVFGASVVSLPGGIVLLS